MTLFRFRPLLISMLLSGISAFAFPATSDDTARVLAGLTPAANSPLEALTSQPAWQATASIFENAWQGLEKSRLAPTRQWAVDQLGPVCGRIPVLYYAFSGPDFLYASTFFPKCHTYVLCGLEPVGALPDLLALSQAESIGSIRQLHNSLASILSLSFFRTKDMKTDLQSTALQGTTPVLFTFLARLGKTIDSATLLSLDKQGETTPFETAVSGTKPNGIRIVFRSEPEAPPQTLYYFSADLSNEGLKTHPGYTAFCKKLERGAGLVKAASYLMHDNYFSGIRDLLLERCALILQDDSGIPVAHFPQPNWEILAYGKYLGPIALFKERFQTELDLIYRTTSPGPLPFGIGYRHRSSESNLVLYFRRAELAKINAQAEAVENVNP